MDSSITNRPNSELVQTTKNFLESNNPALWVAGIGMGTVVVAGIAIKAIVKLSNPA